MPVTPVGQNSIGADSLGAAGPRQRVLLRLRYRRSGANVAGAAGDNFRVAKKGDPLADCSGDHEVMAKLVRP